MRRRRLKRLLDREMRIAQAGHAWMCETPEMERYWMGRITAVDRLRRAVGRNRDSGRQE